MLTVNMLGFGAVLTTILVWFSRLLFRKTRSPGPAPISDERVREAVDSGRRIGNHSQWT